MLANRSAAGTQIPNPDKFPNGLAATVDFIHSLGLKAGVYTARSNHTCAYRAAAAAAAMARGRAVRR